MSAGIIMSTWWRFRLIRKEMCQAIND